MACFYVCGTGCLFVVKHVIKFSQRNAWIIVHKLLREMSHEDWHLWAISPITRLD